MDRILRLFACLLLLGILVVQILILQRMPPTLNEILKAKEEHRREVMLKQPIIKINEPVRVEVDNTPLEVEVKNTPLEVEID